MIACIMSLRSTPGGALGGRKWGRCGSVSCCCLAFRLRAVSSVTAPKEIPEWAKGYGAQAESGQRQRSARRTSSSRYSSQELTARPVAARSVITDSIKTPGANDDVKPFGPEWTAREHARATSVCAGPWTSAAAAERHLHPQGGRRRHPATSERSAARLAHQSGGLGVGGFRSSRSDHYLAQFSNVSSYRIG